MAEKRINKVTVLLGRRGSGKTYHLINDFIPMYRDFHPDMKILIVDTCDHPDYNLIASIEIDDIKRWNKASVYRIFDSDIEKVFREISTNLKNCLIIFEDATKYVGKTLTMDTRKFIYDSKQKNLDLIFLFHGFAAAPPEIFRICDAITMFETDNPEYRRKELIEYEKINSAYKKIIASKKPYQHETIRIY